MPLLARQRIASKMIDDYLWPQTDMTKMPRRMNGSCMHLNVSQGVTACLIEICFGGVVGWRCSWRALWCHIRLSHATVDNKIL